ncbi:PREDICTED: uncharacterized protein C17orf99 homolog [Chrysochloris asiatica]|uniref:Uncharacterized protein C17orf99 homolog n=1 Tax=Chrysochloris asiatica TaxID=185453 RepID=A0A9B0TZU7_CHRAS|nr:PREDICTED: uncharacterized protein C17orf99 homolog [Chrysochloris asiatica]
MSRDSQTSVVESWEVTPKIFIEYKVLKVFPKNRHFLITCHSPHAPPPITYILLGNGDIEVNKKIMKTNDPASFSINVTHKSRPDLLSYSCQVLLSSRTRITSEKVLIDWELWAKPVSQPETNFTLMNRGSGPRVEVICQVSSGSPPITYSLVGKDGYVYIQHKSLYGQPANFSFSLMKIPVWLQCQAENNVSVRSSGLILVPPGKLPQGPTLVLVGSLAYISAVTFGMLRCSPMRTN